jgi:hypothetical protein
MSEVPVACNRPDRPWTISARPGQRINLTLYNFTPLRPAHPSTSLLSTAYLSPDDEDEDLTRNQIGNVGYAKLLVIRNNKCETTKSTTHPVNWLSILERNAKLRVELWLQISQQLKEIFYPNVIIDFFSKRFLADI